MMRYRPTKREQQMRNSRHKKGKGAGGQACRHVAASGVSPTRTLQLTGNQFRPSTTMSKPTFGLGVGLNTSNQVRWASEFAGKGHRTASQHLCSAASKVCGSPGSAMCPNACQARRCSFPSLPHLPLHLCFVPHSNAEEHASLVGPPPSSPSAQTVCNGMTAHGPSIWPCIVIGIPTQHLQPAAATSP